MPTTGAATAIPLFKVFMPPSVMPALGEVLFSGYVGDGPKAAAFERAFGEMIGRPCPLAVNSGTSALQLALRLAGVEGGEVISSPMTCVATNQAIVAAGASVVWADIDPWTGNLAVDDVVRRLSPRTRAIVAVHWAGYPCDLDELAAIGRAHGVAVIEDAAHALGATYRGAPIGSHSDFVCFSFQAIKHVTTGDGGAVACRLPEDTERGRRLRWFALDRSVDPQWRWDQDIVEAGYKFHMNDISAAIGLEQLKHAPANLALHRANAGAFDAAFADLDGVRPLRYREDRRSARWIYTLRVRDRDAFTAHMTAAGIGVSRVHTRNDRYSVFAASRRSLSGVDEFDAEQIAIPCGWWLAPGDVARIVDAVRRFAGRR
jgi:perosamine synthetase